MIRACSVLVLLLCLSWSGRVVAQEAAKVRKQIQKAAAKESGTPRSRLDQRFGSAAPKIGQLLPDISAFDADGNEVKLRSLGGHYSVLVFGCLT